jgi:hypothetical protein
VCVGEVKIASSGSGWGARACVAMADAPRATPQIGEKKLHYHDIRVQHPLGFEIQERQYYKYRGS